jgi:putative Mn2+ efflux pump MntP
MDLFSIFLIGISLSMDALAVSISTGITLGRVRPRHVLKIALFFGVFQALMPLLGWAAGQTVASYIEDWDHWLAFVLLAGIGIWMLVEAIRGGEQEKTADPTATGTLLILAVATSIDALAVGISFSFVRVNIFQAIAVIGCTTLILSALGVLLGRRLGKLFEKRASILGGIILIGIGVKILLEHLLG